ncbi:YybS family protein [Thermodesulfobacteriota bacterium]
MTAQGSFPISREVIRAIGVTTLCAAFALYVPVLGFLFAVFLPLPVLFYRSKLGRESGGIVLAGSVAFLWVLIGQKILSGAVFFFIELLLLGFILQEIFERRLSVEKTVAYSSGAVLGLALVWLVVRSMMSSTGLPDLLAGHMKGSLESVLMVYKEVGFSEEYTRTMAGALDKIVYVLVRVVPAMMVVSTLVVVWSNILVVRPLLRERNLFCPDFGTLNEWKAPEHLVWVAIACGVLLLVPLTFLRFVGLNGLIMLMPIYFFQGIAIVSYYMERKNVPRPLRVFLYSFIALQQFLLFLVIGLGLFDLWGDFRRLRRSV